MLEADYGIAGCEYPTDQRSSPPFEATVAGHDESKSALTVVPEARRDFRLIVVAERRDEWQELQRNSA
jgi:hypothetical protein